MEDLGLCAGSNPAASTGLLTCLHAHVQLLSDQVEASGHTEIQQWSDGTEQTEEH